MADMMMSERPSNGGSLGGGASAGVSIGNYKGVMLCNRPFGGVAAAAHKAASGGDGHVPFRSAVIPHEPLGLNPSRERRAMVRVERKKKDSALSRHKKWLKQLQKAKEQFQEQAVREENAKEEKRKRFAAQQAALRAEVRNTVEDAIEEADALEMAATKLAEAERENDRAIEQELKKLDMYEQKNQEEDEGKKEEQSLSKAQLKRANNNRSKPAWALTEEQKEQLEDEEADDLMDFANNLDVDKYLDDLEVRAALESVRQRIQEIDNEDEGDAQDDNVDAENDYGSKYEENEYIGNQPKSEKKKVKKMKLTKESLNALIGADEGKTQDDDARSIASHASARSVLSDVKSLRGIHSARSLAQLAKQTAKEMGKKNSAGPLAAIPEVEFIPPKISIVDDKKGIREEIKDRASGLPYLHRNPAV